MAMFNSELLVYQRVYGFDEKQKGTTRMFNG